MDIFTKETYAQNAHTCKERLYIEMGRRGNDIPV